MQNFRVLASILTDISNFPPEGGRKKEREKERKGRSEGRDQDVELRLCPKGKGLRSLKVFLTSGIYKELNWFSYI